MTTSQVAKVPVKKKRGGARKGTGPKPGFRHHPATIEKIRNSINAKLCIDTLTKLVTEGTKDDSVRVQAATVLLRKIVPDLSATDLTSGGEPLTIERVMFKPPAKRKAKS